MSVEIRTLTLRGAAIPAGEDLRREPTREADRITDHYRENYDDRTLFYDAVRLPAQGRVLITAPRLLNLSRLVRDGLRQDGVPVRRLKHRVFPKLELLSFLDTGGELSLEMPYGRHTIPLREPLTNFFAGLCCAKTLSKNNPLDWICDWARFHVYHHGLEAVLFFDNGSSDYQLEQIGSALADVPGLRRAAVVSAPYLYGPRDARGGGLTNPMFLQLALLNLARVEILAEARAVFNGDIDELILPLSDQNMFSAAERSVTGVVRLAGDYAFPSPGSAGSQGPRFHRWRADPAKKSTGKWCARPNGPLSRFGWYVHQVGGELRRLVRDDPRFALVHCWSASPARGGEGWAGQLVADPHLGQALDQAGLLLTDTRS